MQDLSLTGAWILVGHDGGMHVIAGEYHCKVYRQRSCTWQGRQRELAVKLGGNTGFNLVLSRTRFFIFISITIV